MEKYSISIIGAGMSGLLAGIAAQKEGHRVKIYEQAEKLTNIGGGLLLYPNGVRVLKSLGMEKEIDQMDPNLEHYRMLDQNHETIIQGSFLEFSYITGGRIVPVVRSDLQQLLANHLEPGTIQLKRKFKSLVQDHHGISVFFNDGSEIRADILIGADGNKSQVRSQLFGNIKLEYQDICFWGGVLDGLQDASLPENTLNLFLGHNRLGMNFPTASNTKCWYAGVRFSELNLEKNSDKISFLRRYDQDWNKSMLGAIESPTSSHNFEEKVFRLPDLESWHYERTVLIGDAAHAMGPTAGLGISSAFEDALILIRSLSSKLHWSHAFRCYESIRKPANEIFQAVELEQTRVKISAKHEVMEQRKEFYTRSTVTDIYKPLYPIIRKEALNENMEIASAVE